MQIQQISVNKLFGIFDHVIPLNMDKRITIIHGPNGFGKTAMLRLLNGFFNSRYSVFRTIPFSQFQIDFNNGDRVEISKNPETPDKQKKREQISFDFYELGQEKTSYPLKAHKNNSVLNFPVNIIDDLIPELRRVAPKMWEHMTTGETLFLDDVIDRFDDRLPSQSYLRDEPKWLIKLRKNIHIRLIESQRLLNFVHSRSSRVKSGTSSMSPTVSAYSEEIAQLIQYKLAEYGSISQSLDRTFPVRVLQRQTTPEVTDEQLRDQLNELEEIRSRLIEVGLINKEENSDFPIQSNLIDKSIRNILSVYIEDVERKLGVFSEIASKIELLRRIINNKFSYSFKEMSFNDEKGFVFKTLYHPPSARKVDASPSRPFSPPGGLMEPFNASLQRDRKS